MPTLPDVSLLPRPECLDFSGGVVLYRNQELLDVGPLWKAVNVVHLHREGIRIHDDAEESIEKREVAVWSSFECGQGAYERARTLPQDRGGGHDDTRPIFTSQALGPVLASRL